MTDSPKFGTSGLRGRSAQLLDGVAARFVAAFLSSAVGPAGPLLVGRDLRSSSSGLLAEVARGAAAMGVEAVDCGELPTPALALESRRLGRLAVMITGSHIPADRNGLKFYRNGNEIDKAEEAAILSALADMSMPAAAPVAAWPGVLERFLVRYAPLVPPGVLSGRRIGVWQQSTVLRQALPDVLRRLGAEIIALGWSDAFIPIDTEAVSAADQAMLGAWVAEHRLDALVSTDGDGDRPLLVDDLGRFVRGDVLGALTARFLGADAIVTPVTSNSAIEASGWFREVRRTRVGSPHVIAGMADAVTAGAARVVGFEANGGVLLGSDIGALTSLPTRDALLPLLAVLAAAGQGPLSRLIDSLPGRVARSGRLEHVEAARSAALMQSLRSDAALVARLWSGAGRIVSVSEIDGLRYVLASGDIVHVRPSGNAPELRCYTEAADAARADWLLAHGLDALRRALG